MEVSVHVRVRHTTKELGVVLPEEVRVGGSIFLQSRSVDFKDFRLRPLCLVFLLNCNEGIAFFCLRNALEWSYIMGEMKRISTFSSLRVALEALEGSIAVVDAIIAIRLGCGLGRRALFDSENCPALPLKFHAT